MAALTWAAALSGGRAGAGLRAPVKGERGCASGHSDPLMSRQAQSWVGRPWPPSASCSAPQPRQLIAVPGIKGPQLGGDQGAGLGSGAWARFCLLWAASPWAGRRFSKKGLLTGFSEILPGDIWKPGKKYHLKAASSFLTLMRQRFEFTVPFIGKNPLMSP